MESVGAGAFHGGYGSVSLRECLERFVPQEPTTSAVLHSGAGMKTNPSQLTNPPQCNHMYCISKSSRSRTSMSQRTSFTSSTTCQLDSVWGTSCQIIIHTVLCIFFSSALDMEFKKRFTELTVNHSTFETMLISSHWENLDPLAMSSNLQVSDQQ